MANPLACILSFSMMLRYSFDMAEEADLIESAVRRALASGVRTNDIVQPNTGRVSTRVMSDTVLRELEKAGKKDPLNRLTRPAGRSKLPPVNGKKCARTDGSRGANR